jgi:hypothetical protein
MTKARQREHHRKVMLSENLQAIAEVTVDLKDRSIKNLCVERALAVHPSGLKDGNSPVLIPYLKVNMFEEKTTTITLLLKVVVEGEPV